MNRPERADAYVLAPGEPKVTYAADTKTENTGTFTFNKEDHTLGNLLRMQLLRDKDIRFSGYIMPHPLINRMDLKVMTDAAVKQPKDNVGYALEDLIGETNAINDKFDAATKMWKERNNM